MAYEIKNNINGYYKDGVYVPAEYETDEDVAQKKYYYFLRPFPVEGQYVLEIFNRNDDNAKLVEEIDSLTEDISFIDERMERLEKRHDEYMNPKMETDVTGAEVDVSLGANYRKSIASFNECLSYFNEKAGTSLSVIDIFSAYKERYSTLIDDTVSEEIKEKTKEDFDVYLNGGTNSVGNEFDGFIEDCTNVLASARDYISKIDKKADPGKYEVEMSKLEEFDESSSNYHEFILKLIKEDTEHFNYKEQKGQKLQKKKEAEIELGEKGQDKVFIAYKLLNRNADEPDENGFWREVLVSSESDGIYTLMVCDSQSKVVHELKVENKLIYKDYKVPNRYFISFQKTTKEFTISCERTGLLSSGSILTYVYKNKGSANLGPEFNQYECESLKNFTITFDFDLENKIYRNLSVNKLSKKNARRWSIFDARKPYPIDEEEVIEEITEDVWKQKPLKERVKYNVKGMSSTDSDMQEIFSKLEQVKPLLSSLMPISQLMEPLEPVMSTLETAKKTSEKVTKNIEKFKSAVDEINSTPIVNKAAAPFLMLFEILTQLIGLVVMFYIKNADIIHKIMEIKEKCDPDKVKKQIDEVKDLIAEKKKELEEKKKKRKEAEENGKLKEQDKKKMDTISSVTETTKVPQGTGDDLMNNINLKALVPEIPEELLKELDKIQKTLDSLKETADTVKTLKTIGDDVEDAYDTINASMMLISGTPMVGDLYKQWYSGMKSDIQDTLYQYDLQQAELKRKASEKIYVKKEKILVKVPLEQTIDEKEALAKAIPTIKKKKQI